MGGKKVDMTDVIAENYYKNHLDVLVCLGGGGTLKNAYRLAQNGLNIITLPKTIDNDIMGTDITFGFDTALSIAVDAIDRLHSTASSHHNHCSQCREMDATSKASTTTSTCTATCHKPTPSPPHSMPLI